MNSRYIVAGVIRDGENIVLGKKAKGEMPYPDVWHTPGGGAEDFETAKRLFDEKDYDNEFFHNELRRELREETNLEVKNIKNIVPTYRDKPREAETKNHNGEMTHFYFLEYVCDYDSGELKAGDDLAEVQWVEKKGLKNFSLTPPSEEMYKELGWI